jgi:hypothetical protein
MSGPSPANEYTKVVPPTRIEVTALFVTGDGKGGRSSDHEGIERIARVAAARKNVFFII